MASVPEQVSNKSVPAYHSAGSSGGRRVNAASLSPRQLCVLQVLDGPTVKTLVAFVITLNAIQVFYETDIGTKCKYGKDQDACDQQDGWLTSMNWVYLFLYSVELGFRIYVERLGCFCDPNH